MIRSRFFDRDRSATARSQTARRLSASALTSARMWVLAALAIGLTVAGTASAQVTAKANVGFSQHDQSFNKDGERVDNPSTLTDVSILLGAQYDIFMGVYAGADLNIVNRNVSTVTGGVKSVRKRFDVRELHLNLGYAADLAVLSLDAGVGMKIDLAKQENLGADEIAVSDSNHAFKVWVRAMANLGLAGVGAEVRVVVPFERELTLGGTITQIEEGVIVDPRLLLSIGVGIVDIGLDVGLIYQAERFVNRTLQVDSDSYVLHVVPSVGVNFGGHSVRFALGFQDENYELGIPIVGKNHRAPQIPPMSLAWRGTF